MADHLGIFDAALRFSDRLSRQRAIVELSYRIVTDAGERCGGCRKWMTSQCPRESHSNVTGRRSGPNRNGIKCGQYIEEHHHTEFREKLKSDLAELSAPTTEGAEHE